MEISSIQIHNPKFEAYRFGLTKNIVSKEPVQKFVPNKEINNSSLKDRIINSVNQFGNNLKSYFLGYPKRIKYTWVHKKAYLKVEKELTGKNTLRGYLHDLDKLIMYIIGVPKETAHNIHVATAPHHIQNNHIKYAKGAVIDWESAHYTKPDKPLTAREYYEKFCPKMSEIEEYLNKFNL